MPRKFLLTVLFCLSTFSLHANEPPFPKGETITYAIKKLGLSVGEASYVFNGSTQIEGKQAFLLTFTAKAFNFFDEEKIYFDPTTFYPIMVQRNLNIFGKKEKIVEHYFHDKGEVIITKIAKKKETQQTIKKTGPIDNLICFIYRYRKFGTFQKDETLNMHLPTKDAAIRLLREENIKIATKQYNTYYLQSIPPQYKLWFSTGKNKIPLRISGALGPLNATMIMKNYKNPESRF